VSFLIDPNFNINKVVLTDGLKTISKWNILRKFINRNSLDITKVAEAINKYIETNRDTLTSPQRDTAFKNITTITQKFSKNKDKEKVSSTVRVMFLILNKIQQSLCGDEIRNPEDIRKQKQANLLKDQQPPTLTSYWECWNMKNATDYGALLGTLPAGAGPNKAQRVNIAFGDYSFATDNEGKTTIGFVNGQQKSDGNTYSVTDLQSDIQQIHQNKGQVILSLGGATFSMSKVVTDKNSAIQLANNIVQVIQQDGLDGVDFDIEDGSVSANLQLLVYSTIRKALPNTIITYTMPAMGELYEPWATVLKQAAPQNIFSSVMVMAYDYYWSGYSFDTEFQTLLNMGYSSQQITRGIMPGYADDPQEYVTTQDAQNIAFDIKQKGCNAMYWDFNRDTNHRTGYAGQNNVYETGQPDGSYLTAISNGLLGISWNFPTPSAPPLEQQYSNQACYFDMGGLGSCIWDFIAWDNQQNAEAFQVDKFNTYLQNLFIQMQNAGMNQIDLSFSQLCDIDSLIAADYSQLSPNDVIGSLLQQMVDSKIVFPANTNLLSLITAAAKQNAMNISLSLGGENASSSDFTICKQGETAEDQAQKLANFMNNYGIASVDFDVEGTSAAALGNQPDAQTFFSSLKQNLAANNQTVTLTIQGSLSATVWGTGQKGNPASFNGPLKSLFYDVSNQPIFNTLFNGVNLMMYDSGAHYYLDDKGFSDDTFTPDWFVEDWLNIVGRQNTSMLHIGFQDATQYQLAASSASGHTYYESNDPTDPLAVKVTDSSGVAGAKIFLQMQRTLTQDNYTTKLGDPFWWPNYNGGRYNPNGNFVSQTMQDFYTTLNSLENCSD